MVAAMGVNVSDTLNKVKRFAYFFVKQPLCRDVLGAKNRPKAAVRYAGKHHCCGGDVAGVSCAAGTLMMMGGC